MATFVDTDVHDGVGLVTLARPPVNSIDLEVVLEIPRAFDELLRRDVTSVVLTGRGPCFSAGIDVKTVPFYARDQQREMVAGINTMLRALYGYPRPVISAINGHAIGGGLVIALCGDHRVGPQGDHQLTLPEVSAGFPFPAGAMEIVRGELAPWAARRLVLGRPESGPIDPVASGIVDELQPVDRVLPRALELARTYGQSPRTTYTRVKRQLRAVTLDRLELIVTEGLDPMLDGWLSDETRAAPATLGRLAGPDHRGD